MPRRRRKKTNKNTTIVISDEPGHARRSKSHRKKSNKMEQMSMQQMPMQQMPGQQMMEMPGQQMMGDGMPSHHRSHAILKNHGPKTNRYDGIEVMSLLFTYLLIVCEHRPL
jgi:hypothetical protein